MSPFDDKVVGLSSNFSSLLVLFIFHYSDIKRRNKGGRSHRVESFFIVVSNMQYIYTYVKKKTTKFR